MVGGQMGGMGQAQQDVMQKVMGGAPKYPGPTLSDPMMQGVLNQISQINQSQASGNGGKGGMPGAQQQGAASPFMSMQQNPMQQNPMQQQGLASLLKPQQSSTNSLQ